MVYAGSEGRIYSCLLSWVQLDAVKAEFTSVRAASEAETGELRKMLEVAEAEASTNPSLLGGSACGEHCPHPGSKGFSFALL